MKNQKWLELKERKRVFDNQRLSEQILSNIVSDAQKCGWKNALCDALYRFPPSRQPRALQIIAEMTDHAEIEKAIRAELAKGK